RRVLFRSAIHGFGPDRRENFERVRTEDAAVHEVGFIRADQVGQPREQRARDGLGRHAVVQAAIDGVKRAAVFEVVGNPIDFRITPHEALEAGNHLPVAFQVKRLPEFRHLLGPLQGPSRGEPCARVPSVHAYYEGRSRQRTCRLRGRGRTGTASPYVSAISCGTESAVSRISDSSAAVLGATPSPRTASLNTALRTPL